MARSCQMAKCIKKCTVPPDGGHKRGIGTIGSRSDYGNAEVTRKAKGFWDSDSDDEAQAIEPVACGP